MRPFFKINLIVPIFLCLLLSASGQNRIGTGSVREMFNQYCANCHGEKLDGGLGGSLLEGEWQRIGEDLSFLDYVKHGNEADGMPAFGAALTDPQIRSLEIYIDEMRQKAERAGRVLVPEDAGVYSAGGYRFRVEVVAEDLSIPWGIAFLPEGGFLVTERPGTLRVFKDGVLSEPIQGTPEVWHHGQGGMMEVALHPDYAGNAWVYLGYAATSGEREGRAVGMTKIARGRIKEHQWTDTKIIYEAPHSTHTHGGAHFGVRFVFKEGYLFFGVGDRGIMQDAQDLSVPNGKIHRIYDDGRIPADNPFADDESALHSIWTYGNRNPQGLSLEPGTGRIWESEHGPRGGDEINLIERGLNYGWPVITHGMNYNGTPITEKTAMPGMEQPKVQWTPSIAVCGMDFYEGSLFPDWSGNLLVGGLASQQVHRLVIEGEEVISDEIIVKDLGRVRDVGVGPEGAVYLVLNGPDRIVRLLPVE